MSKQNRVRASGSRKGGEGDSVWVVVGGSGGLAVVRGRWAVVFKFPGRG